MATILRNAGLTVVEQPGWLTRSRASGGFYVVRGIQVHHTAESPLMDGITSSNYMTFQAPVKPIANAYVSRKGVWYVQAAGATNTAGAGGPYLDIPKDSANSRSLAVEIGNNGIGEPYPPGQQLSVLAGLAALWQAYSNRFGWSEDYRRIFAHFEWAPTRKIDPFGPSDWNDDRKIKWIMPSLRLDVEAMVDRMNYVPPVLEPIPTPVPTPTPTPVPAPVPPTPPAPTPMEEEMLVKVRVKVPEPTPVGVPSPTGTTRVALATFYGPVYTLPTGMKVIPWMIWSGSGNYGKVINRDNIYTEHKMPTIEIELSDAQNITLLGAVPVGDPYWDWNVTRDFANTPV